jgi:hypothetical protein
MLAGGGWMSDEFDRIKSALSDIARAVRAIKTHPERDVAFHLDRIVRAANEIKKHAGVAEDNRDRLALAAHRQNYAP